MVLVRVYVSRSSYINFHTMLSKHQRRIEFNRFHYNSFHHAIFHQKTRMLERHEGSVLQRNNG